MTDQRPSALRMPSVDKMQCGQCGDWLQLADIEGHLASEGRTLDATRPAELDVARALAERAADTDALTIVLRSAKPWADELAARLAADKEHFND